MLNKLNGKSARLVILSGCVVGCYFCSGLAAADKAASSTGTTILPATITPPVAPPGSYIKVAFNWEAAGPLQQADSVFVHIQDTHGKTVLQADHGPSVPTDSELWKGQISYVRSVCFPETAADGTYRIVAGLYSKKDRETLRAGIGVTELEGKAYEVGRIRLEKGAARPKADTEGPKTLDLTGYKVTFNEEFDAPLDVSPHGPGTRWTSHTPWNGDFGDAAFAEPKPGFPFTVEKGMLRIEARKDATGKWRSGLLASNDSKGNGFSQQYGYFEMRAKLPKGPGVWPAFWLSSSPPGGSPNIEIDVLEFYGDPVGSYMSTLHVWKPGPHRAPDFQVVTRPNEVSDDFHNYGVMVESEWLTMYFDGVAVWRTKTPPEHQRPLMVLLNLALGGGWPIDKTPNPSFMYVDYVRAYGK